MNSMQSFKCLLESWAQLIIQRCLASKDRIATWQNIRQEYEEELA